MTEDFQYRLKKTYLKLLKACVKGNLKKQKKLEQKLMMLELQKRGKI